MSDAPSDPDPAEQLPVDPELFGLRPAEPNEELKALIGQQPESNVEKVGHYMGEVGWAYLKPHYEAGSVIYVDPGLSLKEVGEAFAEDRADQVAAWKKQGDLVVPSEPHAQHWEASQARFSAAVVMPFVLIQPVAGSA